MIILWPKDCAGMDGGIVPVLPACPLAVVCRCGSLSACTHLTAICIHSTCR